MNLTHAPRTAGGQAQLRRSGEADGRRWLAVYLNDHLAGATGGLALCRRAARAYPTQDAGVELRRLAAEISEDRETLVGLIRELGLPVRRYKIAAGWLAERAGRLKSNGRLARRSPLSDLLELEALLLGMRGKTLLWQTLRQITDHHPGLDPELLDRLAANAERQADAVADLRRAAAEVLT
ncbi:hypothetical protein KCMC57_up60530 [Kitasatospora sp. CMC57]|uniref:Uncharacterized protein n=1 Tax=Kitasatospora sp. CMC57 TaxID=3231513 RepID=A0AB33K632_9ACTN